MGEKIEVHGRWYEEIDPPDEDMIPEEESFYLPVTIINKMSVFCRYNDTSLPQ